MPKCVAVLQALNICSCWALPCLHVSKLHGLCAAWDATGKQHVSVAKKITYDKPPWATIRY
jgi:hypothetical protein